MLPRLYNASLDTSYYNNNGHGFLRDCLSCEVTEEINGAYTLTMTVAGTDPLIEKIKISMFLKVKSNNDDPPQLFEINKIVVKPDGTREIQAHHIKFLFCQNCISNNGNTVGYTLSGTPQDVMDDIINDLQFENHFTFSSNITNTTEIDLSDSPSKKLGDILAGTENSLLSEYGGEYHYNNFKIELLKSRGRHSNYKLMFGYNISDFNQTIINDNEYSHYMGYAKVSSTNEEHPTVVLMGEIVQTSTKCVYPKVKKIDVTDKIKDCFGNDWKVDLSTGLHYSDTIDKISYYTNEEFTKGERSSTDAEVNINVTYDSELDKMQDLRLADYVKVCFDSQKSSYESQITKVVYDSLAERYKSIEVGDKVLSVLDFLNKNRR